MDNRIIWVPLAQLLDPDHNPSTKVVRTALRLHPSATPQELETLTALSRNTVQGALAQKQKRCASAPRVYIPKRLLAEPKVGAQAKVLYGILQALPDSRRETGRFTYADLSAFTGLSRTTLRQAITELAEARWCRITQRTRKSPITFKLGRPDLRRSLAEAALAKRRIDRAEFKGEAIMQEYLSLVIKSADFTDWARPGFLVNPLTGERLEFDRFYPGHNLAFEFHGAQHDYASGEFSQEEVDSQKVKDLIKAGICVYRSIDLVIIRAAELTLEGVTAKVGRRMELRDLTGHEPLIDALESAALSYRAKAKAGQG